MDCYKALNTEKNEVRLVYFTQQLSLSATATSQYTRDILRLEMRTVSLDDYTEDSREWMNSNGNKSYKMIDYCANIGISPTGVSDNEERVEDLGRFKEATAELYTRSDFGRWLWGDFVALSYTWGDARNTRTILVNDKPMEVTENLEDFLRQSVVDQLSGKAERMGYWIDALCINQKDVDERNFQVKRMRDIYALASGVMVWLGKEADESETAINILKYFAAIRLSDPVATSAEGASCLATILDDEEL